MNAKAQSTKPLTAEQAESRVRDDEAARTSTPLRPHGPIADQPAVRAALALLPAGHPVAPVARAACREFGHLTSLGSTACGRCWEHAIRCDERVVIEFGLTAEDEAPDPDYVDEVAVRRALDGEALPLDNNEWNEVIGRRAAEGIEPSAISECMCAQCRAVRTRPDGLVPRAEGAALTETHETPRVA